MLTRDKASIPAIRNLLHDITGYRAGAALVVILLISTILATRSALGEVIDTPFGPFEGSHTVDCWVDTFDTDEDGYARWDVNVSERVTVFSPDFSCPDGYVLKRGDLDDGDPEVHPRRTEVYGNLIDDNSDGRVDEPTFFYFVDGNDNDEHGFDIKIKINDAVVVDTWEASQVFPFLTYLSYEIEYQKLANSGVTHRTGILPIDYVDVYPGHAQTEVRLGGLRKGRIYRARIQFYETDLLDDIHVPIGEHSDWYYTTTDHFTTMGETRTRILLRGFYERQQSEVQGNVGYLGLDYVDGTKYCADPGKTWCSEFYSWVTDFELDGMDCRYGTGQLSGGTGGIIGYFLDEFGAFTLVNDPSDFVYTTRRGDYLAVDPGHDGNVDHSTMFLAYDETLDLLWTLDGNGDGRSGGPCAEPEIGGSPDDETCGGWEKRRGGNEVVVQKTDIDWVVGWGEIIDDMLE